MALSYRVQFHGLTSLNACKEFLSVYNAIKIRELLQDCKSKALLKAISTRFNILSRIFHMLDQHVSVDLELRDRGL